MIRLRGSIPKTFRFVGLDNSLSSPGRISAASFVELWKKPSRTHYSSRRWRSTSSSTENGPSYLFHPGSAPLVDQTLGQLLDQAANRFPNRDCIVSVHQNIRLTFSEARKRADTLAAGLKKLGLNKGDRIGLWGPNTIEWYITFLASTRGGFKIVGINPADQPTELEYGLQKVGIRAVVAPDIFKTQNYPEMLLDAKSRCPTLEHIIIASDKHFTGTRRFVDVESLPSSIEVEAIGAEQSEISPDSGATIQFTSGTTGRPKAAEVSHTSYANNARQGMQRLELGNAHNTICLNVPLFHAFALVMGLAGHLHAGSTIVLAGPSFNPSEAINAIVKEKCTAIYGTPTMWVDMVNRQQEMNAPIGKISRGLTGGSPASPDLFQRTRETFGFDNMKVNVYLDWTTAGASLEEAYGIHAANIRHEKATSVSHVCRRESIYGLTETTGICFQSLPDTSKELAETTVGHLSDHTEAQVVDKNGVPVPFGTPGELWVRGYHTMIGYWEDEENTRKTVDDNGWLKTGDQFIIRPDGYGRVIGRLKDMLIRGGENIFPKEIEDFLETHPGVIEAHVFGVHDDRLGEDVCACIRLRKGFDLTVEDVRKYGKGKIAHFKLPRYVHLVQEFPKTTTGKVKKNLLREALEARGTVPTRPKFN